MDEYELKLLRLTFFLSSIAMIFSMATLGVLFNRSVTGRLLFDLDARRLRKGEVGGILVAESGSPIEQAIVQLDPATLTQLRILDVDGHTVRQIATSPISDTIAAIGRDARSALPNNDFYVLNAGTTFTTPTTIASNVIAAAWSADADYLLYTIAPNYSGIYTDTAVLNSILPINQFAHYVWDKTTGESLTALPIIDRDTQYHWSPTASLLAAKNGDQLLITQPSGDIVHQHTAAVSGLIGWSADGNYLHYWSNTAGGNEFWRIEAESGQTELVQSIADRHFETLTPSHTGEQIAFTLAYSDSVTNSLGIIDYVSRTYKTVDLPESTKTHPSMVADMAWSPNSTHLAFVAATHDDSESTIEDPFAQSEIFVFDVMSATLKQITDNDWHDSTVRWSPDGDYVLFKSRWPRRWSHFIAPINHDRQRQFFVPFNRQVEQVEWVENIKRPPPAPTPTPDLASSIIEMLPQTIQPLEATPTP